ncbi:MAG: hypothetical protein IPM29_03255 [Planctomycetes bacterium]|nr:hypothetical protein [Planctomycetota bacterium]
MQSRVSVAVLLTASFLPAQLAITSPRGFDTIEGSTSFNHFDSSADRRYQQIDATHLGNPFVVQSLGFRRNGTSTGGGTNEPPRSMDLEITFGLANMAVLSREFDPNFIAGSRQVCFVRRQVNMPDWTGLNGTPSPFDFVVPLDVPFPYAGSDSLVIDFDYQNLVWSVPGVSGGSSADREYTGAVTTTGVSIGTGCSAGGAGGGAFGHGMRLEDNGVGAGPYGMRLRVDASNAPPSTPVLLNIDLQDANLSVPGLCTTVHALPLLAFPFGVSDTQGSIPETSLSFVYHPVLVGVQLVTQLASFDPTQPQIPIILSDGRQATMPAGPSTLSHACVYHWASGGGSSGTLFFGGGMVMQLGL